MFEPFRSWCWGGSSCRAGCDATWRTSGALARCPVRPYSVAEHFHNGNPLPVYRKFREHGRMMPSGLVYVSSWVDDDFTRCYRSCRRRIAENQATAASGTGRM